MKSADDLKAAGWTHVPAEGLIAHLGGLWQREAGGEASFGFLALPIHANRNGVVHGGMLMTFVDRAFGMTARLRAGVPRGATVSLTHQFVAPMAIGDFAQVTPRVVRITPRMAFVEGIVLVGDAPVVQAQGVWRLASARSAD